MTRRAAEVLRRVPHVRGARAGREADGRRRRSSPRRTPSAAASARPTCAARRGASCGSRCAPLRRGGARRGSRGARPRARARPRHGRAMAVSARAARHIAPARAVDARQEDPACAAPPSPPSPSPPRSPPATRRRRLPRGRRGAARPSTRPRSTATVSPCDDFFRFACGGWLAQTEIPPDRSFWHRGFAELEERNQRQLREDPGRGRRRGRSTRPTASATSSAPTTPPAWTRRASRRAASRTCAAEWARIDAIQDRPGSPTRSRGCTPPARRRRSRCTRTRTRRTRPQVMLTIVQGGLSLPDRDFYLQDDERQGPRSARTSPGTCAACSRSRGVPAARVEADAAAVEELERALAETHWTQTEARDPARIYNRVDRAGLEKLAPVFPWARFFAGLGQPELAAVNVTTPRFVERAGQLFGAAPLEAWKAYLRWHLLAAMARRARACRRRSSRSASGFESKAFSGAKELRPALEALRGRPRTTRSASRSARPTCGSTSGPRGRSAPPGSSARSRRPWSATSSGCRGWTTPTKAGARRKLATLVNKVGYPEVWRDYSTLEVTRASFFENVLAAARFETEPPARQGGQAARPQRVAHEPAHGERLLQPVHERDGLPGGHPPAAVLQPRPRPRR